MDPIAATGSAYDEMMIALNKCRFVHEVPPVAGWLAGRLAFTGQWRRRCAVVRFGRARPEAGGARTSGRPGGTLTHRLVYKETSQASPAMMTTLDGECRRCVGGTGGLRGLRTAASRAVELDLLFACAGSAVAAPWLCGDWSWSLRNEMAHSRAPASAVCPIPAWLGWLAAFPCAAGAVLPARLAKECRE